MTRFFYDTEFLERGPFHPINLISIGIVAEDGREYYGVNGEVELTPIANHAWLVENVVPHLPLSLRYVPHVALSGDTVYLPRLSWDEGNHEAMKRIRITLWPMPAGSATHIATSPPSLRSSRSDDPRCPAAACCRQP